MATRIARSFRAYAARCREFAETTPYEEWRAPLLRQAEDWEMAAGRLERDAELIISSRVLMAQVDAEWQRMYGASLGGSRPKNALVIENFSTQYPIQRVRLSHAMTMDAA
jgi:hypothetical protein